MSMTDASAASSAVSATPDAVEPPVGPCGEVLAMGVLPRSRAEQPPAAWVRGLCPRCGGELISNLYYVGGKGYVVRWECWDSLPVEGGGVGQPPPCDFAKVM